MTASRAEVLVAVLAEHVFDGKAYYQRTDQWSATCRADDWVQRGDMGGLEAAYVAHHAHVAAALDAALAAQEGDRKSWEFDVLNGFIRAMPATGEAPDYIAALTGVMLHARAQEEAAAEGGETVTNLAPERHIVVSYTPGTDNVRAMPADGEHHDADAAALREAADLLAPDSGDAGRVEAMPIPPRARHLWVDDYARGLADGGADLADRIAAVEAAFVGLQSCGGLTVEAEGCFAADAVRAVRAALGDPAATLAEVKAAAWDEAHGDMCSAAANGLAPCAHANPYRIESEAGR